MSGHEVLVVLGTRPEIVKLAPAIRAMADSNSLDPRVLHTGQHYDEELSSVFFDDLGVPRPDNHLRVGSGTQAQQTAAGLKGVERTIVERAPDAVVAVGDTNAVLSAALATAKIDPPFVHVEAGIRSYDRSMPEEINRVVADHVSDVAFAPTQTAFNQLHEECVVADVHLVGNTIVDACLDHLSIARQKSSILQDIGVNEGEYAVATVHRPRNTDDSGRLRKIARALDEQPMPVVFPTHPRTKAALEALNFKPTKSLRLTEPLGYLDFLRLLAESAVAVTDSGGVQEEASILEIPCLTVRPNTERPETVSAGVNRLIEPGELSESLCDLLTNPDLRESMKGSPDLYGDGTAGSQIALTLETELD